MWILETERLLMRPHEFADAAFMMELNSNPKVIQYTGDPPFKSIEDTYPILERLKLQFKDGMGRFVVVQKSDLKPVGWCGLKYHETEQLVDLGYRFKEEFWGLGYATESSLACIDYAWNKLKLDRLVAHAAVENEASVKVLLKLGFRPMGGENQRLGMRTLDFELLRPRV